MGEDRDPKEPIKVTDRRTFTKEGLRRQPDAAGESGGKPRSSEPARPEIRGEGFTLETPSSHPEEAGGAQDATFLNLVVSIYQSGCIHLGLAEGEASKEAVDFEAARGTIEMLLSLKRKTQGNLTADETRILETLVAELQMTYALKVSDA